MLDTDPRRSNLANATGGGVERPGERVSGGSAGDRAEPTDGNPAAEPASGAQTTPCSEIRVGPAGWSYPDWAGYVYPSPRPKGFHEATYLAEFFDTIEINTSFYSPLQPGHAHQWLERVAGNPRFLFTAKLWQKFTHETFFEAQSGTAAAPARSSSSKLSRVASGSTGIPSAEDERVVRAGFDVLRNAGKLGAVLLQFPFSFHRTSETTAYLTAVLKRFADYPLAVEVRHASWDDPEIFALLREHHTAFCNIDQPIIGKSLSPREGKSLLPREGKSLLQRESKPLLQRESKPLLQREDGPLEPLGAQSILPDDSRSPLPRDSTSPSPGEDPAAPIGYIRLHGRRYDTWFSDDPTIPSHERYNYLYSTEELTPWADRIQSAGEHARKVFAITNNHYLGKGVVNALQLISMLRGAKVNVPEPLRAISGIGEDRVEATREANPVSDGEGNQGLRLRRRRQETARGGADS
jgi:uncharacterized protein YecE (DUF72 family)